MSIYLNEVVIQELEKMDGLIGTDDGRHVESDIQILRDALDRIDSYLLKQHHDFVYVDGNMWSKASDSLDIILDEFNLEVADEPMSNYDDYKWAITFK